MPVNVLYHLHPFTPTLWCHHSWVAKSAQIRISISTLHDLFWENIARVQCSAGPDNVFCTFTHTHLSFLFLFLFYLQRPATQFQHSVAMAFWSSVWSASLFPFQTESHRRKLCLPSWEPQSKPCEVSRPQRHMFGISASIWTEHSRYTLKEQSSYRPKHKMLTYKYDSPNAKPGSVSTFK